MSLKRIEVPPPHPDCEYCMKGWRRICEEYTFTDEKFVKCAVYYESHGYVHLPHIMPSTDQVDFMTPCEPDCPWRNNA